MVTSTMLPAKEAAVQVRARVGRAEGACGARRGRGRMVACLCARVPPHFPRIFPQRTHAPRSARSPAYLPTQPTRPPRPPTLPPHVRCRTQKQAVPRLVQLLSSEHLGLAVAAAAALAMVTVVREGKYAVVGTQVRSMGLMLNFAA